MKAFFLIISLLSIAHVQDGFASQSSTDPVSPSQYKKGDLVRVKSNSDKGKGLILGTYHELNGKTVFEEGSLDFVQYLIGVLPQEVMEKLHAPIKSEQEHREIDSFVQAHLNKENLDQPHHIYVVELSPEEICVVHESHLANHIE